MLKSKVIKHFGSVTAVAEALGISSQAVSMWPDVVPVSRQFQLQLLTDGALKACIPSQTSGKQNADKEQGQGKATE